VLLADSAEQLQQMLDVAYDYACSWQFRFNTKDGKSNVVLCPFAEGLANRQQFRLGPNVLNPVPEYKYLGVEMGQAGLGNWNSYIRRVDKNAGFVMRQLLHSVRGTSPLRLRTAVHLEKTLVRPVAHVHFTANVD
jgi:hypothetical protein